MDTSEPSGELVDKLAEAVHRIRWNDSTNLSKPDAMDYQITTAVLTIAKPFILERQKKQMDERFEQCRCKIIIDTTCEIHAELSKEILDHDNAQRTN